jgi:hypothetical protein
MRKVSNNSKTKEKNGNNHVCLSELGLYYARSSGTQPRTKCDHTVISILRPEIHQICATYAEVVSYISGIVCNFSWVFNGK